MKKRASFKARHGKNIAKGKMSAAYWANKRNGDGPRKRRNESEASKRKIADAEKYKSKAVGDAVIALGASGGGAALGMGVDAFTGEAGTFNSGELGQNILSAGLLIGTGAAGGAAAASALDSNFGKTRDTKFDQQKRIPPMMLKAEHLVVTQVTFLVGIVKIVKVE